MRQASALRRQTGAAASNVIGARVREARQRRGLTLTALDERVQTLWGFSMGQSTLTRIERGTRSVYDFEVLALSKALEVDARWLLGLLGEALEHLTE